MTTATSHPVRYRKTKSGEWVAYGPLATLASRSGTEVVKANGDVEVRTITRLGRPFTAGGVEMVYAYLAPRTQVQAARARDQRRPTAGAHTYYCPTRIGGPCDCDD